MALEDQRLAEPAERCVDGDVESCNRVARTRYELDPDNPTLLVTGLLEYSCELEGSGTLGERLRRLTEVGEGCILLSRAYDTQGVPEQALLTLDQACVLGRADACEQAAARRHAAFAARIVRECESVDLPVATSCVELGVLLQQEEVPTATFDDFDAFQEGCRLGAEEGCVYLGDYVDRWGIEHERVVQAETQLARACKAGEPRACAGSAHLLVRHDPRTAPYGKALELFQMACEAGLASACEAGAEQRRIGKARKTETPDQLSMWGASCDLHSASGCFGLGDRLARTKKTWPSAYESWTRSCDLGYAQACTELGLLVENPRKEPFPQEEPRDRYLERGCDNGDPEGCYWLAADDVPRNGEPPEAAYLLLDRSCTGNFGLGCAELADVHLDRKTSFDDEIAARHLDTACANGEFESCKDLGNMYRLGKGVERDRQRANELLERFRFNARRKHVRIGARAGLAYGGGGELELVVPVPIGPALALNGGYSYVPGGGAVLMMLVGEEATNAPDFTYAGVGARLYSNPQARGIYGGIDVGQLQATGGDLGSEVLTRQGWAARLGVRNDSGMFYTGLELGFGQYGFFYMNDFDDDETGVIPLIVPTFGFSAGLAFL